MPKPKTDQKARQLREQQLDKRLEQHTWKIWGYVREHRHSLNSERVCTRILAGYRQATDGIRRDLAEAETELTTTQEKLKQARRELRKAEKRLAARVDD